MERLFWKNKALELLSERSVLWIGGVRRTGKTTLCQQLPGVAYFDCELPTVRQQLEDIERFFKKFKKEVVVLDEIHRLTNPSEILKIAADHFPSCRVVATGSSTLSAKKKFKDSLTGRKREMWLVPAISSDLNDFGKPDIQNRMLKGGLPPFLLSEKINDRDFIEWIDSFWAKDLSELFLVEKRDSFMKFIELLFRQSGELFEAQPFSSICEVSRQTIQNYLSILETTLLVTVLRPFSDGSSVELKSQPKVYGFDTGFICFFRGLSELGLEDKGKLLEHLTLNELAAHYEKSEIFYWRDKQKHEVDFILKKGRSRELTAIECKSKSTQFTPEGMQAFRRRYPEGSNIVVCLDVQEPEKRTVKDLDLVFCSFSHLSRVVLGR